MWPFGPKEGTQHYGPVAYCDDYGLVDRPGYYALSTDGKRLNSKLRLVYVDDAPDDEEDGRGHYEVAGKRDPIQRQGRIVALEANLEGTSGANG